MSEDRKEGYDPEVVQRIAEIAHRDPGLYQRVDTDKALFEELYDREAPRVRAEREAREAREEQERKARLKDPRFIARELKKRESATPPTPKDPPGPSAEEVREKRLLRAVRGSSPGDGESGEGHLRAIARYLQNKDRRGE